MISEMPDADDGALGLKPTFTVGGDLPARESRGRKSAVHIAALFALAASCAYLSWRVGFTLGRDLWISIPLWLLELSAVGSLALYSFSLWDLDSGPTVENVDVSGLRVAVLIATYNESREVLLPTVAAAITLEPEHETWVLDDGGRGWVKELAESLGARYLAREERSHAKAGNLNNALSVIDVDVIAVLDADHVATTGFLTKTLPYFEDPSIAVVQTPQDFYNVESFEHAVNRSWFWRERRRVSYNEQRLFYRAVQPGKNRWNAAFWCGTNALVRVSALRAIGGIAEETVTEDMHTTIRLHRSGWRTMYHNEVLAYGIASRNAKEYQAQRSRWGTGAMQILHVEHPLLGRGLTLRQRLAYASTILGWFDAWRTLGYVLLPLAVLFSGAIPIQAPASWFVITFGATFLAQRLALAMLSRGYAPQGMAVLFEFVRMQSNIRATLSYFDRREHAFRVTAKQRTATRRRVRSPRLLVGLLFLTVIAGIWFALTLSGVTPISYRIPWTAYGAAGWALFNAVILVFAILRIRSDRYATERRAAARLKIDAPVEIDNRTGRLVDVSIGGALVRTTELIDKSRTDYLVRILIGHDEITLSTKIVGSHALGESGELVMLQFSPDQDSEIARLSNALFAGDAAPVALTADERAA